MADTILLLSLAKQRLRKMTGEELNQIPQEVIDLIANVDEILGSSEAPPELIRKKQLLDAQTDGRIH